jgi:hypothetical protein
MIRRIRFNRRRRRNAEPTRYKYPGKYEGGLALDEYIHSLSLDGADDEVGDVSTTGWYGLMTGPFDPPSESEMREYDLGPNDVVFLKRQVGAIIHEDDRGFVDVEWYTNKRQLQRDWKAIVKEIGDMYEGEYY